MNNKLCKFWVTVFFFFGPIFHASAYAGACFDLNKPNKYPDEGIKLYFNLQKKADDDLALEKRAHEENPGVQPIVSSVRIALPNFDPYSLKGGVLLWPNKIQPEEYDSDPLETKSTSEDEGRVPAIYLYFYEPSLAGGQRICRIEEWTHRGNPSHYDYRAQWREPSLSNFPALKKLLADYAPNEMRLFAYDKKERIEEVFTFGFDRDEKSSSKSWYPWTPRQCYFWREDGKLSRFVVDALGLPHCNAAKPGNASYFDYKYTDSGQFAGSLQIINGNPKKPDGIKWSGIYRYYTERKVEAESNNLWGLHYLRGLPQIEDVPDRLLPDHKLAAFYRFPQYTPISVMDGLPLSVKAHRRIRQGPAGAGTVSEMFPPNGGLTERIFWRDFGGTVFRHERFKNGKPFRIINDGLLDEEKIRAGMYDEDLATLDRVISQPKINVPRANVRLRVYDVDPAGRQTLVALSWSQRVEEPYSNPPSRARLWRDVKQGIASALKGKDAKPVPAPKPATAEQLRVRYTDITGKEIWRDWDVFVAKTGYVQTIQEFYPYGDPESDKPPLETPRSPLR